MSFNYLKKLPTPEEIKEQLPVPKDVQEIKAARDKEVADIITGKDDRFLCIIGPCSADNEDAVCEYIDKLARVADDIKDKVLVVPRIYTNKPRTTGSGYKGIASQPDPNEAPDMVAGLIAMRKMHIRAMTETHLTAADEMLYPENHKYLDDLLGYVAIGARSVEDQQHRLTASGIEVPVGMKNPTSGDLSVMMNAILAAQHRHSFIYRGWEVHSEGNPHCHAILRGSTDKHGINQQNYHYEDLIRLCDAYDARELQNPAVIVDTNHSNSNKNPFEQQRIVMDVLNSCRHSERINKLVKGFMIESYIEDGAQKIGEGIYGKSITDPCLGWEKTEKLIYEIADKL